MLNVQVCSNIGFNYVVVEGGGSIWRIFNRVLICI